MSGGGAAFDMRSSSAHDGLPAFRRPLLQQQRFASAVRKLLAVRAGDRIVARAQFAKEDAIRIGGIALAPRSEAARPPIPERVDPDFMLREMQRQLHLAAVGDAALKRIGAVENAPDISLVFGADRLHHFTVDDIVREIGAEPHFRHGVHQQQGREHIVGDAVAMRLELDRQALFGRNFEPRPDDLDHVGNRKRHHLADDDHERRADVLGEMNGGTQLLDRARKGGEQPFKSRAAEFRNDLARRFDVHRPEVDRHAVEAGLAHLRRTVRRSVSPRRRACAARSPKAIDRL